MKGKKKSINISTETRIDTYVDVDVEVDVDFEIVESYIEEADNDELKQIIIQASKRLQNDGVGGLLSYHNPSIMEELAMNALQDILNSRGPEWILETLKQH